MGEGPVVLSEEEFNRLNDDPEALDAYLQKKAEEIQAVKAGHRTVVKAAIGQWIKDFQDGKIVISSVDDLKKLIELDIRLSKDEF